MMAHFSVSFVTAPLSATSGASVSVKAPDRFSQNGSWL